MAGRKVVGMRLGRHDSLLIFAVVCLISLNACRKAPQQQELEVSPSAPVSEQKQIPVAKTSPASDFSRQALEIHHASQEMALDGFQYGKNHLGWPFEIGAASSQAYLIKLVQEKFLPEEAAKWLDRDWHVANLSDADPGETAFLKLTQPDQTILIVTKNGQSAILQDTTAADAFAKEPPREPAWLP